ncbi:alpha-glucosidase [Klebsiella pneumoniae]|uniref:family 4 glycosyl hydrolase n=1 Tax=Enterobacteriaceae TaxID=543 RepID=UPI0007968940|nr:MULTISPECIES: alpha-glucosidase [Enterobacteriaceae]HEE0912657.1 alpha-glucosidase [Klebsiella pneumoniae]AOV15633.1 alpha-glucosidase [Klebsiella sp. LTGPAF-6F]ELD2092655.1 alpha-glucosidase [Enterobacter hormaechei]ELJ6259113.1 alpha-glucosidase [Klebsiella michiganensis]MBO2808792.1 alpha-glucosidase [Enterobacter hormaechei]
MSTKIVLIGAGSAQFGYGTLGDIFQSSTLAGSEIVLHDINPVALAATEQTAKNFIAAHDIPFSVTATTDRQAALQGAEFIMISIEVGDRFALWDMDWKLPQQYGIPQVYGENGGPGGLFHSLRIIPPILAICQDIADICPDAWIFNYSNPMSRICTTVNRRFPQLNFVGMCHEIASLERYLPEILHTPFEDLQLRAGGLNHFSVLLEARYRRSGEDAYADIRANAPAYFEKLPGYSDILAYTQKYGHLINTEGATERHSLGGQDSAFTWADRQLFKAILERFHYLPITGDSHFGEYISWAYEMSDHRGILDFYTFYRDYLGHVQPVIELKLKERVVPIIEGILTDASYEEAAVNIPNKGFIKQLPEFIAVEVPAIIDSKGIHGIEVNVPAGIAGLLTNQVAIHDLTAEAVLNQSRDLVIQALLVDSVNNKCAHIPELVDLMIASQRPYLDYLK